MSCQQNTARLMGSVAAARSLPRVKKPQPSRAADSQPTSRPTAVAPIVGHVVVSSVSRGAAVAATSTASNTVQAFPGATGISFASYVLTAAAPRWFVPSSSKLHRGLPSWRQATRRTGQPTIAEIMSSSIAQTVRFSSNMLRKANFPLGNRQTPVLVGHLYQSAFLFQHLHELQQPLPRVGSRDLAQ